MRPSFHGQRRLLYMQYSARFLARNELAVNKLPSVFKRCGQHELEHSISRHGLYADARAVLVKNALHYRKSEARTAYFVGMAENAIGYFNSILMI